MQEHQRLYLSNSLNNSSLNNSSSALTTEHYYEQALMQHIGVASSPALALPFVYLPTFEQTSEEPETTEEDIEENVPERTSVNVPSRRVSQVFRTEESPENRSPFGDVITSVDEIMRAKNGGRYMPPPRERVLSDADREQAQKQQQRRVVLHPAITVRYFVPPNPNLAHNDRRHNRNKSTKEFPAAIPKVGIFDVLPAETQTFYDKVQSYLSNNALLARGSTIIAAVSGGVDSITLLDMLVKLQKTHKYKIIVLHFNHRLRGNESEVDEYFVRETAKRYGLPCYVAAADIGLVSRRERISIEHAARELRYNAMEFLSRKLNADAVCTAHTQNDSVETLLLNLLRGSGLAGLSGIPSERAFGGQGKVIRPMLNMKKADVMRYAELRTLSWREDSSNNLTQFTRNKIRHNLLPQLESEYSSGIVDVLARTAHILSGADEMVSETVERLFAYVLVQDDTQPYIALRVSALRLQTPFLQSEILRRAVQKRFHLALPFDAVERLLALCNAETGAKADLTRNYFAVRDRDLLLVSERIAVTDLNARVEKNNQYDFGGWRIFLDEIDRKNVKFTSDPAVEFFDSERLPYRMTLRKWQAGDVFTPLGMKGTMKVSDFLTNSKISFFNRQHILALTAMQEDGEKLVWLCGLRLNEEFKVQPTTRRVLRVEFRRPKLPTPRLIEAEDEE